MSQGRRISRLKLIIPNEETKKRYLWEWPAKKIREDFEELPKLNSKNVFGNRKPLEVEIGPGTGEYLCDLAINNRNHNFLGIEASRKAIYFAVNRAAEEKLTNLRFLQANFLLLLPLIKNENWNRVYLHYPDPVHKRKNEKRRIFTRYFLDQIAPVLIPNGKISVVSDNLEFFEEMLTVAESHDSFRFSHPDQKWIEFHPNQKSRFQKFWEGKGVHARRFILVKQV